MSQDDQGWEIDHKIKARPLKEQNPATIIAITILILLLLSILGR